MYNKSKIHCTSVKKANLFSIKKALYVYKSTSLRNSTMYMTPDSIYKFTRIVKYSLF